MNNNEVIVAGLGPGVLRSREFARLAEDTFDCSNVL